ncbi:MAG: spermidine/putrescine ABC transporter substrate-binding protein [Lachnospiraceae bacterium]|nr:spermidine/putrescine ABC transporter substrate-binding protein [Lachnospiraceae bacterium]
MNNRKMMIGKKITALLCAGLLIAGIFSGSCMSAQAAEQDSADEIVLRVCNWEEYIDEGDWDEEEEIDLPSGGIIGELPVTEDFEEWYEETYGQRVRVEYSTFGTNEDLYNMLTLGDVFDLVCPSEYMIMKLMAEQQLVPLSESFFDEEDENNYYIKGVSPYIRDIFDTQEINGEAWGKYAAGYMWGVTGFVYNPEAVSEEDASTWQILNDSAFKRQVTIKDNVRDSYFAAVGALKSDLLLSESFRSDPDYKKNLEREMNDTSPEMIAQVQDYLQSVKDNVYSFETDAGKADMITGKVVANYQWSGDGVYTLDQADEDDYELAFAVPKECTNIYFDGWVMLRSGVEGDSTKQHAAEAFINFNSRPDIAIRNMYYIGYTSVLSGGEDPRIFEYAEYNYGAEEEEDLTEEEDAAEEETSEEEDAAEEEGNAGETDASGEEIIEYDISYFFGGEDCEDGTYVIVAPAEAMHRQLFAAYPTREVLNRSSVMIYFTPEQNAAINRMWVNVRCYNIRSVPVWAWILILLLIAGAVFAYTKIRKRFYGVG